MPSSKEKENGPRRPPAPLPPLPPAPNVNPLATMHWTLETVLVNQDKIFKNQEKMHKQLCQLTGASADDLEGGGKRRKRKSDSLEEVNGELAQSLRAVKEDYFDELWEIFVEYAKTNKVYALRNKNGIPVATGFINEAIDVLKKKHGDDLGKHLRQQDLDEQVSTDEPKEMRVGHVSTTTSTRESPRAGRPWSNDQRI
ncbi:hypothetical protein BJ166DRAFT_625702 [Pestalotiopsis sp. NC0098]|nr:hypothetical protein BJ166DRAFT_625702 [Pestalotiopsis sp. NC0098]